jgi:hypothetical protein
MIFHSFRKEAITLKTDNKSCGNCGNYDVKKKRCKIDNSYKTKVHGCSIRFKAKEVK